MIQRTLLLILMVWCPLGLALAGDWSQWRGPDRTGVSKETGLLQSWPPEGPKLLWTFRDAGAGYSCMSVMGDRLYSMGTEGNKDCVFALDLNTHKKLWSTAVGPLYKDTQGFSDGPRSTPTIDGNFLYAIGGYGDLVCVDTASGRKVWSQGLKMMSKEFPGYGYTESPLVDGDLVVATPWGEKGGIAAFDKKTGTLKWHTTTFTGSCKTYSSMIAIEIGGVRQYVQSTGWYMIGVRASDGKLLWEFARSDGDVVLPICHDNCVYVSSANQGNLLLKLIREGDQFKTKQIYANKRIKNDYCGAVRVGEYLYGYMWYDGWMCQDFKTGEVVWTKNPRMGKGTVIFADGNLYGYHENRGDVLLIKATPDGYKEQGKFRIPEQTKLPRGRGRIYTHPVVANGKLYLRDSDLIFCYDVRKPK